RSHGTLPAVVPNQWPFELIHESMNKVLHDDGRRLPASEVSVDDPPPEPRHTHRSAKPQDREIDTLEPSENVGGCGLRAIAGTGAGECRGRREDCGNTGAAGRFGCGSSFAHFEVIRGQTPDGRHDAGPPAGMNTVVLRLGNEPRRGVHDLEPRLIRVPAVAGH